MYIDIKINERYYFIKGYENYIITENGNVYTYRNGKTGYNGFRELKKKGINSKKRYLQVCLCNKGEKKYTQIHRIVAEYFCEGYFDGAVVNHIDGNIHNNVYSNLEWITQRDNVVKSYDTSSVNQVRNFKLWTIIHPNGEMSNLLKGKNEIINYINKNKLDVKYSMLSKHKFHNDFILKESK